MTDHSARSRPPLTVVGLMSGTSADAIDAVLVRVSESGDELRVETLASHAWPLADRLRERILQACDPATGNTELICELNFEIGEALAAAASAVIAAAGSAGNDVDLIGSHGQTIYHRGAPPPPGIASTLQIGDPGIIAERTGITAVAGFRPRDMAAGGQGAPLVSYVDWALYRSAMEHRALQNLGGIANVTVLPAGCAPADVFAFDTGPGNLLIDATANLATGGDLNLDHDGHLARAGRPDTDLLQIILRHPFLHLPPPKTTGREEFGLAFAQQLWSRGGAAGLRPEDIVATCTLATARSIADAYRRWVLPKVAVDAMYLSGGGALNPVLVDWLRRELPDVSVRLLDDLGGNVKTKEALAFAVLAAETVRGVATGLPGATGARHPSVLGTIVPGTNWQALVERLADEARRPGASGPGGGGAEEKWRQEDGPPHRIVAAKQTAASSVPRPVRPSAPPPPGPQAPRLMVGIGIDGGGTKTEAVALDPSGTIVARAASGPGNIHAAGREEAARSLRDALASLIAALPDNAAVIGLHAALAGIGRPEDEAMARAMLEEICADPALGARLGHLLDGGIGVSNDAMAALAAATNDDVGVVLIAGTGTLAWARRSDGVTARAGGWGYLLGDEGSAYDLGRRSLAAVLTGHDGRSAGTSLTGLVLRQWELDAPPDLVRRIYGSAHAREEIAALAPLVITAAAAGDEVAAQLVRQTVASLADLVRAVVRRLGLGPAPYPVVCAGGLLSARGLIEAVQEALADCVGAACRKLDRSPAEGAARLATRAARRGR